MSMCLCVCMQLVRNTVVEMEFNNINLYFIARKADGLLKDVILSKCRVTLL